MAVLGIFQKLVKTFYEVELFEAFRLKFSFASDAFPLDSFTMVASNQIWIYDHLLTLFDSVDQYDMPKLGSGIIFCDHWHPKSRKFVTGLKNEILVSEGQNPFFMICVSFG
jgi:hypothetical protein